MKGDPETAPEPTPWEKVVELARKVAQTPKAEVDRRERAWRAERNGSGVDSHISNHGNLI